MEAERTGSARLGRNLAALGGGQLVTWSMTLLWTLVVPRALGPHGMGLLVSAWAATGIFSIVLGLGTRNYLVREMVVDPGRASELLGTALALRLLLAPLFALAVFLYAQVAHYGQEGTLVLYLAGVASLLTLLSEPYLGSFQAVERMEYLAYSDVINKSAQGLLGVALALVGFRAVGITASWVAVAVVVFAMNAYWARRHIKPLLRTTSARLADLVRQSVSYWAFGVFFMIYLWIDSLMLSLMTRAEVVGWYGVPMRLFQSLMFLPVVISTAYLPRLVRAFRGSRFELERAARTPIELVVVLSLPICAGTAIVAGPLIHVLYGSQFDEAIPVLVVLGLCIPPMYLNIMLNQVLVAAKRQASWTWVMVGATVVNPLLNAVLITVTQDRYGNGAIGAAASLVLTELGIVTVGLILVGRSFVDRSSVSRCLLAGFASILMWGVAYLASPLGFIPSAIAGAATFLVAAVLFRLATPEELEFVRGALRRRRAPVHDAQPQPETASA
jgi:O-antigen/teichoic acid export membrane protein